MKRFDLTRLLFGALFAGLLAVPESAPAAVTTFGPGSLIIPMDTGANGQNLGMLRAYGLVYELLDNNVPVSWAINPAKGPNGDDFAIVMSNALQDIKTGAVLAPRSYRGGPFVIAASNAAAALPIIQAWQATAGDNTAVHRFTGPGSFTADVARQLISAPRISILKDGNEAIAFNNLNAAGIPDSIGQLWSAASPDLLTETEVAGLSTINHTDGALFSGPGGLTRYGYVAAMHYSVITVLTPEVVAEFRAALAATSLGHAFMQCQAMMTFENDPSGFFLTTLGLTDDGPTTPSPANRAPSDPLVQLDGNFQVDTGQVDSIGLAPGSIFRPGVQTLINDNASSVLQRIVLLTGRLDGASANSRVTYLAGHDYSTELPITTFPQTNGVRLFLNSIFDSDCAASLVQPDVLLSITAPQITNANQFSYTITYTNPGPRPVENIQLIDRLPVGATYIANSAVPAPTTIAGGVLTWNLPPLAPGASASVTFQVSVATDGSYTNQAQMSFAHLTLRQISSDPVTTTRDSVPPTVTVTAGPSGATNRNSPSFRFTTDPTAVTTACSIDNVGFVPCSPDPAEYTSTALSDGPHTFIVKVTDAAGNTAQATRAFAVDTAPPTVTIADPPTNPSATSNPTPKFYFSASDDGGPVTTFCSVEGDPYVPCTSPFTSRSLPDGPHAFSVYGRDAAGNSGPVAAFSFTIDHLAPIVSIPVPPNRTLFGTPMPSFTFSDSSAPGSPTTAQCRIDGGPFVLCTSPSTFTVGSALSEGSHTLTVQITDAAGNSGQGSLSFVVDLTPPETTITSYPPDVTNNHRPIFEFVANDAASTAQCSIDGSAFAPCLSPFTAPSLADGSHTFSVRATDAAGNPDPTPAVRTFTVDTVSPVVTIPGPPANPATTGDSTPTFVFSVSEPATAQCQIDSGSFVPCAGQFTVGTPLAVGSHIFKVNATDAAGNVGSASFTFTVTTPVLVSITVSPANSSVPKTYSRQFTATGTFSDGTTQDLTASATWSSSNRSVATISNAASSKGLANGLAPGTTQITAQFGSVSGSTTLAVTNAVLVSITVTPANASIVAGSSRQFTASGTFSDGTTQDLTASATWSSSSSSVATISNTAGSKGLATGGHAGTTQIKAQSGSVSGSTTLTVTARPPSYDLVFASNRDGSYQAKYKDDDDCKARSNFEIYGMKADGTGVVRLTNNPAADLNPALSPDRTKIVFTSNRDGNFELYSMNPDGSGVTRLTSNVAIDGFSAWSPTGAKIVFTSTRDGNSEIYSMNANGTGLARLTNNPGIDVNPAWSPNGLKIAFASTRNGNFEIYSMNADGSGVTRLTNDAGIDGFPTWSPDSQKIAFMSTRPGNAEIYSMSANGTGVTRLTNNAAIDAEPAWGANDKISFSTTRNGNFEIYSMSPNGTNLTRLTNHPGWDISPSW